MLTSKHYRRVLSAAFTGLFLLLFTVLALTVPANAASPKDPKPVGVVNSSNGSVFPTGNYAVILKYDYFTGDQLYDGSDEVDFARPQQGKKINEQIFQRYRLLLRTGLFENVDVRMILPVVVKEMKRQSSNKDFSDDQSGLGDIVVYSRYQVLSQKKKNPFNLAVGLGLSLPTGSTDEEDDSGATLPGFLQNGTGSVDPLFEVGAHKMSGRSMFSGYMMYRMTNEGELGDRDFERPNVFGYNLGYVYALSNLFDLQLELNGKVMSKAEMNGVENDNTGGHILHLTPGVHVKFWKKMHVGIAIPTVIYRDLNGTQLSEDYQVLVKLAMPF